jgi:hypothetical protein
VRLDQPHGGSASKIGLFAVRYGIGAVLVIAGIVLLVAVPGTGVDGFAMSVGGGLSVVLLNVLYRMGSSGDEERAREEDARRYFDEHGVWPDEPAPRTRRWTLPPGVVPPEDESINQARALSSCPSPPATSTSHSPASRASAASCSSV